VFLERTGDRVSAYSASDGTLRFLAMLAALLGKNPAALYFFEEIDNGIHPARLRLLIDLIEQQTAKGDIQVVTTTHSPDLLSMMSGSTFENTSVVSRLPDSSSSIIRLVKDLPKAAELRKSQGLGRLHASGWMEDAVAFTAPEDGQAVTS
jgi:AAA15 family ATPase/GTPase